MTMALMIHDFANMAAMTSQNGDCSHDDVHGDTHDVHDACGLCDDHDDRDGRDGHDDHDGDVYRNGHDGGVYHDVLQATIVAVVAITITSTGVVQLIVAKSITVQFF